MRIQDLPQGLLQATQNVVETQDVLESCPSCGMVMGSCFHTEGQNDLVSEDAVSALNVPSGDEPEDELSGEKEDVVINPAYITTTTRRPY